MSKYLVHKSCELAKLNKKTQHLLSEPDYLERNYIAQPKHDGCHALVFVDHNPETQAITTGVLSRTGEECNSLLHVEQALWNLAKLPGVGDLSGVYFGEAWAADLDQPTISGLFRTKEPSEETCRLQFVFFDHVTLAEFDAGVSQRGYEERANGISPFLLQIIADGSAPLYPVRSYGKLREIEGMEASAMDFARGLVALGGYDGAIFRDPRGGWIKGDNGTNGEIIKVKPRDTYSFKVVGFTEGKGKNLGTVGSLLLEDGEGKDVGSVNCGDNDTRSKDYYYSVLEGNFIDVEFMGVTAYGKLREPTYKGVRHDVLEAHIV